MNTLDYTTEKIPELITNRLILRQLAMEDAPALFHIWSDCEVTKYLNINAFTHIGQAKEMIELLNQLAVEQKAMRWTIVLKETNHPIGSCGYNTWIKEEGYRGEIGYDLDRKYWGQGIMSEALHGLIQFGFSTMGLNRIEALVEPGNIPSCKLLGKIGFCEEGLLRDYQYNKEKFTDLTMYSLLKREYIHKIV